MNKQIEALKMAIEAIEYNLEWYNIGELGIDKSEQAIQACKEALAEVALNEMQENAEELGLTYCKHGSDSACKECYMEQAEKQEPEIRKATEAEKVGWGQND